MPVYKNIIAVPVYHNRLSFVSVVRDYFYREKPDAVAVELPESLSVPILEGIRRLPAITAVFFRDEVIDEYFYIAVEPGDPFIEALRLGLAHNVSVYFADVHMKAYKPTYMALPDDYVVNLIGYENFYNTVKSVIPRLFKRDDILYGGFPDVFVNIGDNGTPDAEIYKKLDEVDGYTKTLDSAREYYMACYLKTLMEDHHKILFVVGMAHWERIKSLLEADSEGKITLHTEVLDYKPPLNWYLYNIGRKDIQLVLGEVPYFVYMWEHFREMDEDFRNSGDCSRPPGIFDKVKYIPAIYIKALDGYEKRYAERISIFRLKQLVQYLRNLTLIDGRITPELYHIITAAKNIVDDDFAWYVFKTAGYYPFAVENDDKLPTLPVRRNRFFLKGKWIKFRRRYPISFIKRYIRLHKVIEEKDGEDWSEPFRGDYNLVSWPEEDKILEAYYGYIREVGRRILTDYLTRTVKFTGSFLDGVDIRETIRNRVRGDDIYVKEIRRLMGSINDFVIIFDDEELPRYLSPKYGKNGPQKYPYNISFFAEHPGESDLAFFSTPPGKIVVGPGISVIKLGGLLSSFPPLSQTEGIYWDLWDPYHNKFFAQCRLKSERLLLGSLVSTRGKYVIYIDRKRPRNFLYRFASGNGKKIVFIPISSFSRNTLDRIRYMHVIAGAFRRKYAGKYIDLNKKFRF